MDIGELINSIGIFIPQLASSYCVVNRQIVNLDEIQRLGFNEFSAQFIAPAKLYKYFPNKIDEETKTNYSIQALKNNTVFMQAPSQFDDVYDADINISFEDFEKIRLMEYCRRCGITPEKSETTQEIGDLFLKTLHKAYCETQNFLKAFLNQDENEIEGLSNNLFANRVMTAILKNIDLSMAVKNIIIEEYQELLKWLRDTFRVSCFSTTPYSQLMWGGSYADCHRGFCVEYSIIRDERYNNLLFNLHPLIYCSVRPNVTEQLANIKDGQMNKQALWDIYFNGVLRKSIDWVYQDEWRLLWLFDKQETDYNVPFFPITKVYLGNRMDKEKRKEIIDICHERNIEYVGVTRNPNLFQMQDCGVKCEQCPQFTSN